MTKHILNNNNNMLRKHIKLNWFIETFWKQIENVIENKMNFVHGSRPSLSLCDVINLRVSLSFCDVINFCDVIIIITNIL